MIVGWWCWAIIGFFVFFFLLILWGLMAASGKYDRRVEEYEYMKMIEQRRKEKENES